MRRITEKSINAFLNGRNMSAQNMCVSHHAGYSEMFLHGNKIAEKRGDDIVISLAGWPTVTTRERLDALCLMSGSDYRVAQRNHKQVLLDRVTLKPVKEIDDYEWVTI